MYDAIGMIDKDIAAEEEAIRELQTLRNASSPISKLPTRLIARIFFLTKLDIIKARTANVSLTNLRYLNLNNSTYGSTTMLMKEALDAPFLQKLELSGICLPSPIPPLPQLRRLRISRIASGSKSEGMTVTALLSCLLNTPSLEELVVDDALGKLLGKKKDRTTVQLPKLSWISLTTAHVANSTLFQYIQYPASTRINFHSTTEPPRGSDIRNLIAIFSHFATSDAAMRINALSLDYDSTSRKHQKVALTATARGVRYLNISCAALERDVLVDLGASSL
ncbi:hypothetical protein EYR36_011607 [Pleurotus pulmonarius]|nr:hypothetical protein EYR36_011607 [Pleurotus pulmonarius]